MGAVNSAAWVGAVKRFGASVALDRDRGLLELQRALPLPPGIYQAAMLVMAMLFAAIVSIMLMLLGATVGKVVLELAQWSSLFIMAVLGAIPFGGLGSLVGSLVKGQAAPAVLDLVGGGGTFLPHALDLAGLGALFFVVARRALRKVR
jgi:hypothetical protein